MDDVGAYLNPALPLKWHETEASPVPAVAWLDNWRTVSSMSPHRTSRNNPHLGERWVPERPMGLGRSLQKAGYGTRKVADAIVAAGRVTVDGRLETDPKSMVDAHSEIQLDGQSLRRVQKVYMALNKPARVTCTESGLEGTQTVAGLLPGDIPGLRPVGRMDARNTGLMLASNDKDWNVLVGESCELEREYRVQVEGELGKLEVDVIAAGLNIPKMGTIKPLGVRIVEILNGKTVLNIVLTEGKVRQLRRMFTTLRHKILYLRRVRLGSLQLGTLSPGKTRLLTSREVQALSTLAVKKP